MASIPRTGVRKSGLTAGSSDYLMSGKAGWNYGPEVQGFQSTDLSGATLEAADLSRGILAGVVLKGASLARAILNRTFLDCDLSDARDLDDTTHKGASNYDRSPCLAKTTPAREVFERDRSPRLANPGSETSPNFGLLLLLYLLQPRRLTICSAPPRPTARQRSTVLAG